MEEKAAILKMKALKGYLGYLQCLISFDFREELDPSFRTKVSLPHLTH